jgi:hypothetical protein
MLRNYENPNGYFGFRWVSLGYVGFFRFLKNAKISLKNIKIANSKIEILNKR